MIQTNVPVRIDVTPGIDLYFADIHFFKTNKQTKNDMLPRKLNVPRGETLWAERRWTIVAQKTKLV